MTTIAILPDNPGGSPPSFRAIAGHFQSVGRTAGEALDALTAQLDETDNGTLVVVQQLRPDRFFSANQQQRLGELMSRWRVARDNRATLPAEEQAELNALVKAETHATAARAAALLRGLAP
jgi:hypothetical protein